jgi:hypothetical protein
VLAFGFKADNAQNITIISQINISSPGGVPGFGGLSLAYLFGQQKYSSKIYFKSFYGCVPGEIPEKKSLCKESIYIGEK